MPAGFIEMSSTNAGGSSERVWLTISGVRYVAVAEPHPSYETGDFVTFKTADARKDHGPSMAAFIAATEITKADPKTTPLYDHAFTIAFSVKGSTDNDAADVDAAMLRAALFTRIADIDAAPDAAFEWLEATGAPFDSMEQGS